MDAHSQARARLAGDLRALAAAKAQQEPPTAYDRGHEAGSKTAQILVGIPVTVGFIWLVHLYAPWAIGLAIIVAVIGAVAYIAKSVKGS